MKNIVIIIVSIYLALGITMLDYLGIMLIISFTSLNFVQGFFISSSIIFALLVILILLAVCNFNIKGQ